VGLFERTKHLDRLARQIADENLRRLGAHAPDDAASRRHLLELEAILREYRLNLVEAESRKQLAQARLESKRARATTWHENARLASDKGRAELAQQALARAHVYERESEGASAELELHAASVARLEAEIQDAEQRVSSLRALRRGGLPHHPTPPASASTGPATQKLVRRPPRDPLEEEIERLRGA
jgi:chromosome segregation ATPase